MKYMLIMENGNGYHCGCCRRTWESHDIQEFDSDEACKQYIENYNKSYTENQWNNDSVITDAYQMFGNGEKIL